MPIRLCYTIGLFKVADYNRPEKKFECSLKVRALLSAKCTSHHSVVRVVFLKELLRNILAYCPTRNVFYFGKLYLPHFKYSLHLNPLRGSVNNYHTWEWCSLLSIVELQPTTNKSYFCFVIDVIVKVTGICPRRNQHYNQCPFPAFFIAFLNPFRQLPAVRWIAKYYFAPPNFGIARHPLWCNAFCTWHFRECYKGQG